MPDCPSQLVPKVLISLRLVRWKRRSPDARVLEDKLNPGVGVVMVVDIVGGGAATTECFNTMLSIHIRVGVVGSMSEEFSPPYALMLKPIPAASGAGGVGAVALLIGQTYCV